jgi:hypothetical protein
VGPIVGLDDMDKRKFLTLPGLDEPSVIQPVASRYLFYLVCEATGTAATPGLLCQPRVIVMVIVEKLVE